MGNDKKPPGWKDFHEYKHPGNKKVRVTFFWTNLTKSDPAAKMVKASRKMLQEHGIGLDVYPFDRKKAKHPHTLIYPYEVTTRDDVKKLRQLAHEAFDDQKTKDKKQRIPIIFCNYRTSGDHTLGETFKLSNWLPFCLINVKVPSKDGLTLLHEIGHAAGLKCEKYRPGKDSIQNIMHYGAPKRTDMNKKQVLAVARAYFCK